MTDPSTLIQRQLDAYAHDLDGLLATYAGEAKLYEHPATLLGSGTEQLRARFAARFQEPNLHARLLRRIVMGNMVVDHERVTRTFPEGAGTVELIATYEVQDGQIINAWFCSGAKVLDTAAGAGSSPSIAEPLSSTDYQLDRNVDLSILPDAVRHGIRESDPAEVGDRDWQTIGLALRDAGGRIVGGAYGATMWSWLIIDGLWIEPELRRQGLGRRLLLAAEEMAMQRGCLGSWLGTFDFQAKEFYERHGYSVFAELPGFPPEHTHFHLRKLFSSPI